MEIIDNDDLEAQEYELWSVGATGCMVPALCIMGILGLLVWGVWSNWDKIF